MRTPNWIRGLLRRKNEVEPAIRAADLTVVVTAFDPVEADSAALARSPAWVAAAPAVLRHHLRLPGEKVPEAARILAQDGWELEEVSRDGDTVTVHALRVQVLDALHCAQERSRMAGLAQRLGGDSAGWDALQPRSGAPGPT